MSCIYDGKTGFILGRSCRSWGEILLFYFFYYSCIACFFAATVGTFYQYLDAHKPNVIGTDNLLKNQPGLGYEPMIDVGAESNFVWVNTKDDKYNMKHVKRLKEVLAKYKEEEQMKSELSTSGDCAKPPYGDPLFAPKLRTDAETACSVNVQAMEGPECKESENFGYGGPEPKPCILIRLNKIYGFEPDLTKCGDGDTVNMANNTCLNNQIHLTCRGALIPDNDNIESINYSPSAGFPMRYYPYLKQPGYLAPLVFIKLNIQRHVPVSIVCYAIAKNIDVKATVEDKYIGSVRVDVLVD